MHIKNQLSNQCFYYKDFYLKKNKNLFALSPFRFSGGGGGRGGKLPRPGYLHPWGLLPRGSFTPGGQAAQSGGQDTPGYLHSKGKLARGSLTPGGGGGVGKLPRVQDKLVHWY